MAKMKSVSFRITQVQHDRMEALIPFVMEKFKEEMARFGGHTQTGMSVVAREVVEAGLRVLEAERGPVDLEVDGEVANGG